MKRPLIGAALAAAAMLAACTPPDGGGSATTTTPATTAPTTSTTTTSTTSTSTTTTTTPPPAPSYYVTPTGTDAQTCGPISAPCRTVDAALLRARFNNIRSVKLAETGTHPPYPAFTMGSNVTVDGGWRPDFTGRGGGSKVAITPSVGLDTAWAILADGVRLATITNVTVTGAALAPPPKEPRGIFATGNAELTLRDVTVQPGRVGSSPSGMLVADAAQVFVTDSTIESGLPTAGSAYGIRVISNGLVSLTRSRVTGQAAANAASAGAGGVSGWSGCDAESATGTSGGSPCTSGSVAGGRGGNGGRNGIGDPGEASPAGTPGGVDDRGADGADGVPGAPGQGARNDTNLAGDLWANAVATDGGSGGDGAGGGGGAGGRSRTDFFTTLRGGGGGAGGNGGTGGTGGRAAATIAESSFGVYAHNGTIILGDSHVTSSAAAPGYAGGAGGWGSPGGAGGAGGTGPAGDGYSGGGGGAGGSGGGGGGGAGGASIAVFHNGTGSITRSGDTLSTPGTAAPGGPGGVPGPNPFGPVGGRGTDGEKGLLFSVWDNGRTEA